jgi:uncharacterized protein (DUF2252 family)
VRDPVDAIILYNRRFLGRYDAPLRQKLRRLRKGPFRFFRATFHLFARDMADGVLEPWRGSDPFGRTEVRLVGDIHSDNYGTFKAADGTIRYDVNDFDETATGGFDLDVRRAAVSLILAAGENAKRKGMSVSDATAVAERFVRTYVTTMLRFASEGGAAGFGYSNEERPDSGPVRRLLRRAAEADRRDFIKKRTDPDGKLKRTPDADPDAGTEDDPKAGFFELRPEHRRQAERLLADYVRRLPEPETAEERKRRTVFYRIEDICGRVAGGGSLGRLRYAVLLNGEGREDRRNSLLEFKEALPSPLDEVRGRTGGGGGGGGGGGERTRGRAAEVTAVQRAMQTVASRRLGFAVDGDASFQVRGAGPRDKDLESEGIGRDDLPSLAAVQAELLAKCHAKADDAGPPGTAPGLARLAIADALSGRQDTFVRRTTAFALAYAELVAADQHRLKKHWPDVARAWGLPPSD